MSTDFLHDQLCALEPLDFIRLWVPDEEPDEYTLVIEVIREEDPDAFTIRVVGDHDEEMQAALRDLGFDPQELRVTGSASGADVADRIRRALTLVRPDSRKVSLTHGNREEMIRRRKVGSVAARVRELLGKEEEPSVSLLGETIPIHFTADSVQVTLWPKDLPPDTVLEIWALVASALPDSDEVRVLVGRCNEGFSYGRLLRQERFLWYRDILHADPLSETAFKLALRIAVGTAKQYGPRFAELGAKDESMAEPTPSGVPVQPPAAGTSFGYL